MKSDPKPITSDKAFIALMAIAVLIAILGLCCSCQPVKQANDMAGLKEDNPAEEFIEWALDAGLDIDADLTGSSPE